MNGSANYQKGYSSTIFKSLMLAFFMLFSVIGVEIISMKHQRFAPELFRMILFPQFTDHIEHNFIRNKESAEVMLQMIMENMSSIPIGDVV